MRLVRLEGLFCFRIKEAKRLCVRLLFRAHAVTEAMSRAQLPHTFDLH